MVLRAAATRVTWLELIQDQEVLGNNKQEEDDKEKGAARSFKKMVPCHDTAWFKVESRFGKTKRIKINK